MNSDATTSNRHLQLSNAQYQDSPGPTALSALADIDALRGMAALIVVALHIRETSWIGFKKFWGIHTLHLTFQSMLGYVTFPVVWGAIGVSVFFVISGYCIHLNQARLRQEKGAYNVNLKNFYARRFFRIYPVLVGSLLLTAVCDSISRGYFPNSEKLGDASFASFLINLFALQGIAGPYYGSNGPLWTLAIEIQFYALYPILIVAMSRIGLLKTGALLAVMTVTSYFLFQRHAYLLFSSYYLCWYLGVLVAEAESLSWFRRLQIPAERTKFYLFSAVIIGIGCAELFREEYFAFQIWSLGFAIFFVAFVRRPNATHGSLMYIFRELGRFSFSIYVIHAPLTVMFQSVLFNSARQASILPTYFMFPATIALAYIFSLIFEVPALALSKSSRIGMQVMASAAAPLN